MTKSIEEVREERYLSFAKHFRDEVSAALYDYAKNDVLYWSRYLFVDRVKGKQRGYCTHCESEMVIQGKTLKHNEECTCGNCLSRVTVYQAGRGRKRLWDRAYLVWYEKSAADPQAITATGYIVERNYQEDYRGIKTKFSPIVRYLFQKGKATMMERCHYFTRSYYNQRIHYKDGWQFVQNLQSLVNHKAVHSLHCFVSFSSIEEAVKDTPYSYSTWEMHLEAPQTCKSVEEYCGTVSEEYDSRGFEFSDMTHFFSLYSKYPLIEYLSKLGMKKIVVEMVDRTVIVKPIHETVNWAGKTLHEITGLEKQDLKKAAHYGGEIGHKELFNYKWLRDRGVAVDFRIVTDFINLHPTDRDYRNLDNLDDWVSLNKLIPYLIGQVSNLRRNHDVIQYYMDYIRMRMNRGGNLLKRKFLLPENLKEAHDYEARKLKMVEDDETNMKIVSLGKELAGTLSFHSQSFFIRPALSSLELWDEGAALEHCVADYTKRYADGRTYILFVRKASEPDVPFYTMELDPGSYKVLQCRTYDNDPMTEEVKQFVEEYTEEILSKQEAVAV